MKDIENLFSKVDKKTIINQYKSKVLLRVITKNMKAEETKTKIINKNSVKHACKFYFF